MRNKIPERLSIFIRNLELKLEKCSAPKQASLGFLNYSLHSIQLVLG